MQNQPGQFPTQKPHISFSEIKTWKECAWKHKLAHIDKLQEYTDSVYTCLGTTIHDAAEHFLSSRSLDGLIEKACEDINKAWLDNKFDDDEYIDKHFKRAQEQGWKYTHITREQALDMIKSIINSIPAFMDKTFPGWEYVNAEELLYEDTERGIVKFKGYVDAIIKLPEHRGRVKYWVLDWKTTGLGGWSRDKRQDKVIQAQIILYKKFWAAKNNIKLTDINTAYVWLKRGAATGKVCYLFRVASGPKSIEYAMKLLNNMVTSVLGKLKLKNRNSCKFCEFYKTEHCK